jgi:hypothetical protein
MALAAQRQIDRFGLLAILGSVAQEHSHYPDESTRTKLLQSPETSIVLWVTRTAANEDDKKFIFGISRSSNADDKRDPLTLDRLLDKAPLPRKLEKLTPWQVSRRSSSGASRASSMGANHIFNDTLCKCGLVDTTA